MVDGSVVDEFVQLPDGSSGGEESVVGGRMS